MRNAAISTTLLGLLACIAACGGKDDKAAASDAATTCIQPTEADFESFAKEYPSDPNDCSKQMYSKYQDAGFAAVTKKVIELSLAPEATSLIGTSFQDKLAKATTARQEQFSQHLKLFLESVYGSGEVAYPADAPSMTTAHQGLEITFAQYVNFVTKIVVPALQAAGIPEGEISSCFAPPVLSLPVVKTVVTCK